LSIFGEILLEMPLYRKKFLKGEGTLTIWEIEETEEELLSTICMDEREEELCAIRSCKSRLQWLASRLAVKSLFDDDRSVNLKKDVHGKPYLSKYPGHISLSHSGNMAAAVFHPQQCVGIDIERIRPKIIDIDKKFLSLDELQFIAEGKDKLETLFVCWCVKESIYKWHGRKGLSFKDSIAIQPFEYRQKGTVNASIDISGNPVLSIHYENIGEYMLAYLCI